MISTITIDKVIAQCSLPVKTLLIITNAVMVVFLIVLWHTGVLPITQSGTFIFFVVLWFLFALHQPRLAFWFFVGLLPLEIINLAPEVLQLTIRPYQAAGALLVVALVFLWLSGRLPRRFFRWQWWDSVVLLFVASGFIAALFAEVPASAFMQAIIVSSFVLWYFLTRYFVRGSVTAKMPLLFFMTSGTIVLSYGLWQSFQIVHGATATVMARRPNATFDEPDWLALFVVFFIVCLYGLFFALYTKKLSSKALFLRYGALFIILTAAITLLATTVARSAWLGLAVVTIVFVAIMTMHRWRDGVMAAGGIVGSIVAGLSIVIAVPLTTFSLGDRAQSTGSGLQEITVSCLSDEQSKRFFTEEFIINSIDELAQYGCYHINLEDVDRERSAGHFVTRVKRLDPSTIARKEIYKETMGILFQNNVWLTGIGWSQSHRYLGTDTQGTAFNTSNLFLEVWIGAGFVGLLAFFSLSVSIVWQAGYILLKGSCEGKWYAYSLFIFLGFIALFVPNIFNAGILLGFIWVFLGMAAALQKA